MGDEEQIQNFRKLLVQKFQHLMDHYEIPADHKDAWVAVALALAIDHVPGFRRKSTKIGRPPKWKGGNAWGLAAAVMELILEGKTQSHACRVLCEKTGSPYYGQKPTSLLRRFQEIKNQLHVPNSEPEDVFKYIKQRHQKTANSSAKKK